MKHDPADPGGVKLQAIIDAIMRLAKDRGMKYEMPWAEYNNLLYCVQRDVSGLLPYKGRV